MMAASFGTLGRIWSAFLRDLNRRGLKGVKLVISDAHEGLKAAITRGLGATWQRCRVAPLPGGAQHLGNGGFDGLAADKMVDALQFGFAAHPFVIHTAAVHRLTVVS